MWARRVFLIAALATGVAVARSQNMAPDTLPATAAAQLAKNLAAARGHSRHVWRDTPPRNADGTVNAYIEISRGDRRKWELDMAANARAIDREIPESVGGYPVNYGFVPQTVSYDGDPFDALVLNGTHLFPDQLHFVRRDICQFGDVVTAAHRDVCVHFFHSRQLMACHDV